jgi:hypothetical protein
MAEMRQGAWMRTGDPQMCSTGSLSRRFLSPSQPAVLHVGRRSERKHE